VDGVLFSQFESVFLYYIGYYVIGKNSASESFFGSSTPGVYLYDDFRVYTSVLKLTDIQALACMYSNPGKIVPYVHYTFDSWTSGTTITNDGFAGSSRNAVLTNGASVLTNSPVTGTNYLSLNGTYSQHVTIENVKLTGNSWSVCFWYKKEPATMYESDVALFCMGLVSVEAIIHELTVGFYDTTGSLYLKQGDINVSVFASNCCDGTWRHVTIIYDEDSLSYAFYINVIICSNPCTSIGTKTVLCYIGKTVDTSKDYQYATVQIDDFRIYNNVGLSLTSVALLCRSDISIKRIGDVIERYTTD
jgi:hypothetical protein